MEQSKVTGAVGGAASGASAGAAFGPWGAAIGGVIGGVGGFLSGGGEDAAMKLAEQQAKLIKLSSKENIRRMTLDLNMKLGYATAASFAGNIQGKSGSTARFQNALESTGRADMAWEKERARLEAEIAMNMGQAAADQITSASTQSMLKSVTGAVGVFGPSMMPAATNAQGVMNTPVANQRAEQSIGLP